MLCLCMEKGSQTGHPREPTGQADGQTVVLRRRKQSRAVGPPGEKHQAGRLRLQLSVGTLWVQRELTVGQSPRADGTPGPRGPWIHGDQHLSRSGLFKVLSTRWLSHASPPSREMGLMLAVPPTAQGGSGRPKCMPFSAGDGEAGFETTRHGPGALGLIGEAVSPLCPQAPVASLLPLLTHRILTCRVSALQALGAQRIANWEKGEVGPAGS